MTAPSQPDDHRGHHRAAASSSGTATAQRSDAPALQGKGPGGMWWVAWRQHRIQILVLLGVVAAAAAALIIFRLQLVATYQEFGCRRFGGGTGGSDDDCLDGEGLSVWWSHGFSNWSSLAHLAMLAGPIILGAFAGASIFTREFAHGTHVVALTQSVGRLRWFVAKTAVVVLPLVAGLLLLGYLMEWVDKTVAITAYDSLSQENFFARGIIPAATGLMAYGVTIAIGMFVRNVVTALVVGVLAGVAILICVAIGQPYVLPATRIVTPIEAYYLNTGPDTGSAKEVEQSDMDRLPVDTGLLDTSGREVGWAMNRCTTPNWDDTKTEEENSSISITAQIECMKAQDIAEAYTDYLPGSMLWPLRWIMTGIYAVLAALFFGLGAWRLRPSIAKR